MKSTKLSMIFFALALMIGATSIFSLAQTANQITVTEEVLYGNAGSVDGFTLYMKTTMENLHIWDIKTPIGNTEHSVVDYQLHKETQYVNKSTNGDIYMNFSNNFSSSTSGTYDFREVEEINRNSKFVMPILAIEDIASRMKPNSMCTETIVLRDYYKYYPLTIIAQVLNENERLVDLSMDSFLKLENYFKIPVGNEQLTITLTKNAEGVTDISCTPFGIERQVISRSVVCVDEVFIAVGVEEMNSMERKQIGNTEIYHFNLLKEGEEIEIGEITKLKTLDEANYFSSFLEYGEYLIALENREGESTFVVYSKEDFSIKEEISIGDYAYNMEKLEKAVLIYHSTDVFTVITEENNSFRIGFEGEFAKVIDEVAGKYYYDTEVFLVDNKLVVLTEYKKNSSPMGDIIVSIYDEDGLNFASRYTLSQKYDVNEYSSNISVCFEDFYVE